MRIIFRRSCLIRSSEGSWSFRLQTGTPSVFQQRYHSWSLQTVNTLFGIWHQLKNNHDYLVASPLTKALHFAKMVFELMFFQFLWSFSGLISYLVGLGSTKLNFNHLKIRGYSAGQSEKRNHIKQRHIAWNTAVWPSKQHIGTVYCRLVTVAWSGPQMLISQMLQVNVDARFTAEEVLSHPWVTVRALRHVISSILQ